MGKTDRQTDSRLEKAIIYLSNKMAKFFYFFAQTHKFIVSARPDGPDQ